MLQFLTLPDRPPSPLSRQRPSSYLFLSPSPNHHHWWFNKVPEFRSAFSPHHPVMTSDHQQGLIAGSLNLISDHLIPKSCILILKYRPPRLGGGVQFHCYNSLLSKNNILSSSWLQQPNPHVALLTLILSVIVWVLATASYCNLVWKTQVVSEAVTATLSDHVKKYCF